MKREKIEQLTEKILEPIRANYLEGPMSQDRVYEALNALAIAVAYVLAACADPKADRFFANALKSQREDIAEK